ncbi:MAG: hypothetical protein HYY15_03115 [Candidatus Omnitrophica bacterium]|nr:hypothetical protein [Candidatus Omnitrophota bacterium]
MEASQSTQVKYQPCRCALMQREVWAILTKAPDGAWKIVNCLDKDLDCFGKECAFTMDGGCWPFAS